MADRESEQTSMDSTVSDTDIETINTEELVMFNSIQTFYTNRKDLAVVYTKGNLVENNPLDWIGLFKSGWNTLANYSAYQLVSALDPAETSTGRRKTVFPKADILDLFGEFQFMYLTASSQVLGVSDNFLLSDFDPKSESAFVFNERLAQSFSIISLETVPSSSSSSSSSEENQSVDEETFENIKASSEHTVSNSSSAEFQFVPIYTRRDCWSLSDFVVGNNSGTIREKLCFAETFDPKSLIDEYEPLKHFYLSLRSNQKALVEEVNDVRDDPELDSPKKDLVCTDLVPYDKPMPCTLDLRWQDPAVPANMFYFWREYFQHCCLELYRQKLLESKSREHKTRWILPAPNTLVDDVLPKTVQKHVKLAHEVCEVSIPKQPVFSFKKRKTVEKKGVMFVSDSVTEGPRNTVVSTLSGGLSRKQQQQGAKQAANLRKKRSTKLSKSKAERGKQEEMLKEALSLLTSHQTAPLSFSTKTACSESSVSKASLSGKSNSSKPTSRKRPIRAPLSVDKAKRRRLNGKKPSPNLDPCRVEDEGYFTTDDEEDGQGSVKIENQSDNTMDLLSLALVESLKNNADLRLKTQSHDHCIDNKEQIDAAATVNMAGKTVQCANKANTSGKAENTEMKKTCHMASNTARVAKKDTQSQCRKTKMSGKATNTEKKENRHASSNTASVPKKDTPSQCPQTRTSGASTNTAPAPPKKDAEINTPAMNKPKDAAFQSPGPDTVKITEPTEPDTVKVDVILKSLASNRFDRDPPTVSSPEANSEKWSEVASKRMIRLRRLIARKREEFSRLRENAENWENKAHAQEAQVTAIRSLLSAETIKRINVEKDLQDLRTKFWDLLAARKSQPWKTTEPIGCNDGTLVEFSCQRPYPAVKPVPDLQPVSFQCLRNSPVPILDYKYPLASKTTTSDENTDDKLNTLSTPLPENTDMSQGISFNTTNTTDEAFTAINHSESLHITNENEEENTEKSDMTVANMTVLPDVVPQTSSYEVSTLEESSQLNLPKEEVSSETSEMTVTDIISMSDVLPMVSRSRFKSVPLVSTSDYETVPLVSTSAHKTVPAYVEQVKKASSGTISFKRFLMPAMTALSETFRSSKFNSKAGVIVADEHTLTTTTQTVDTKPSAKVTVSFSTGIQTSSSSVKSSNNEGKKRKNGSRSSSRSSKERVNRQEICKVPCQETTPDSNTESCTIHLNPTTFPLDETKTHPLHPSPTLEQPLNLSVQKSTADVAESLEENKSNSEARLGNTTTEWYPLTIPLEVTTGNAVAVGSGTATVGIEPVKFHFNRDRQRESAGKGRSISYADVASGKLTRNLLAAELVAKAKYQAMEELSQEVSAAEADVTHAYAYEDAQIDAPSEPTAQPLPEPSSCSPPPSSASPSSPPSSQSVSLPLKRIISAFSPPSITNPPQSSRAVIMLRDLAVHQTKRGRDQQYYNSQQQQQQQNKQLALPPRPPRALHYNFMKAYSDVISGQIRQGKCLTCGMKFSPAVDRYLVEEHIHFHHAFTE